MSALDVTRREMVGAASLGSVAVASGVGLASARANGAEVAAWQDRIGETFAIKGPRGTEQGRLTGVSTGSTNSGRPAHARQQPFTLTFALAGRDPAAETIYAVSGNAMLMHPGHDRDGRATLRAHFG